MTKYVKLAAMAGYQPERVVTNDELSQFIDTSDEWIQSHTGIKERHYAIDENTSDLGTQVARKLLAQTGMEATEIDLIIVATISPDALTPATAAIVQGNIGATKAFAYDISTACSGFVFALSTAEKFLRSGAYQNAIVIAAETMSKTMDFKDRTSAVFFGDGAAGALLTTTDNPAEEIFHGEKLCTQGDKDVIHSGRVQPLSQVTGDNYPVMDAFYQNGRAVFEFATTTVLAHIKEFMQEHNLQADEIDMVVPHQANLRIIEKLSQGLGIPLEKFAINVQTAGNTSAAGIPLALNQELAKGKRPQKALLVGFGAGLSYATMLVDLSYFNK